MGFTWDLWDETNISFAPEHGWLEFDRFLLGFFLCWKMKFPVVLPTLDGSEIQRSPPGMCMEPCTNNGINYQPQLVQDFFHQQYVQGPCWFQEKTFLRGTNGYLLKTCSFCKHL